MTAGLAGKAKFGLSGGLRKAKGRKAEKKKLKLSTIEEFIVTILNNHQDELYGRQITQAIDLVADEYSVTFGSIYPALQRLEQKDIVTSRWGEDRPEERGGARRRYYKLTDDGKEALDRIQSMREHLLALKID